jgi:hypothetical protein
VVIDIFNTQILAVPEDLAAPTTITVLSGSSKLGGQATAAYQLDKVYPAVGIRDLGTGGQRPFRVIRSQD